MKSADLAETARFDDEYGALRVARKLADVIRSKSFKHDKDLAEVRCYIAFAAVH